MGARVVAPRVVGSLGGVTLQFTSATAAILTLPSGRQVPLIRFSF